MDRMDERMIMAAKSGDVEEIRELRKAGADVNARDEGVGRGRTVLLWAAGEGHAEAIRELLTERDGKKADVNATNNLGATALKCAAGEGHAEAILELLNARNPRADINVKGQDKLTAFAYWRGEGRGKAVERKVSDKYIQEVDRRLNPANS